MNKRRWGDFTPLWIGMILIAGVSTLSLAHHGLPTFHGNASLVSPQLPLGTDTLPPEFNVWRDTIPQWAMAFISLAALALSAWAVVLVRGTLEAAREANKGFKLSAERQLRAYLAFDGLDDATLQGGSILLKPAWKNAGQTPTRNAVCGGWHLLTEEPLPINFAYPDDPSRDEGRFSLGPGCREEFSGPTITIAEGLAASRKHLYVWGWVEYNDVFDNTPRWRTEFCVRWIPSIGGGRLTALHGKHNGADDECLKKPSTR